MYFYGNQSERKCELGDCILAILDIYKFWTVFLDFAHVLKLKTMKSMLVEKRKMQIEPVF